VDCLRPVCRLIPSVELCLEALMPTSVFTAVTVQFIVWDVTPLGCSTDTRIGTENTLHAN